MGRKIPGKKHRTVKDPYKQRQIRLERISSKINNPPRNVEDQEIPKSLLQIMELKKKAKDTKVRNFRRRSKKTPTLSVAKFSDKEKVPKGMGKPEKFIPNLVQKPNESAKNFIHRVSTVTQNLVNEVEFEKKFSVEIKRNLETGEVTEVKNIKKRKSKSKKKKLNEKRKDKLNKKQESLKNIKDFSQLKDDVKFGEVTNRPPNIQVTKKQKNITEKPKYSNLLLNNIVDNTNSKNKNSQSIIEKEKAEKERKFIVSAYRKLKKKT